MNKLSCLKVTPYVNSIYIKPKTIVYVQNGVQKKWDMIEAHNYVSIILHNPEKDTLIFVKQFRPPVYVNVIPQHDISSDGEIDTQRYPAELGITIELCSGIIDKPDLSAEQIAREEVLEECGYDVPLTNFQIVSTIPSSLGNSGVLQTLFYCQVTDGMKVGDGGGIDDELIEVVEMSVADAKAYALQEKIQSPPGMMYGLFWFFHTKYDVANK